MAQATWKIDNKDAVISEGAVIHWDDETFFTITYNGKSYNGEILQENLESNKLQVKVNHRVFDLARKGELDELISQLGLDVPKVRKLKELPAPMPGRIVSVAVTVGQEIQVDDEILTLEAMKMENVLKAEGTGTVKNIFIAQGEVVDKGQILIEFE